MRNFQMLQSDPKSGRLKYLTYVTIVKRTLVLLALVSIFLFSVACYNKTTGETNIGGSISFKLPAFPQSGTHAVVIFSEMHYQPSIRSQEIPRLLSPSDSVPVTGKEKHYKDIASYEKMAIPESVADDEARAISEGENLYNINCLVCHGLHLDGKGPINNYDYGGAKPRNLLDGSVREAFMNGEEGKVFGWISFGGQPGLAAGLRDLPSPSWMPAFNKLLTEEDRWKVVTFLRSKQD